METSDNTTSSPAPTSSAARRSGRVTKVPAKFIPDAPPSSSATKRKRQHTDHDDDDDAEGGAGNESAEDDDEGDAAGEASDLNDDDDNNDDDDEDDHDHGAKRASKKKKKSAGSSQAAARARKPAAKKPKVNGDASTSNGALHAAQLPSRPKKAVRIAIAQSDAEGLYGAWKFIWLRNLLGFGFGLWTLDLEGHDAD